MGCGRARHPEATECGVSWQVNLSLYLCVKLSMTKQTSTSSEPRRIDEELVTIDSCRHLLLTCCGATVPHPTRIKNDPPDFEMTVDDHVHPTEVTSIAVAADIARHAQLKNFQRLVQSRATESGMLSGTYAMVFTRNIQPPRQNSQVGRQLLATALQYVEDTKAHDEAVAATLLTDDNGGTISIKKSSNSAAKVGAVIIDAARWGSETVASVTSLIQERVDEKLRTLANHDVEAANTLLLLYDAHGYADAEMIVEAFESVANYDSFHSVYIALSFTNRPNDLCPGELGREGFFVFSRNANWSGKSTLNAS